MADAQDPQEHNADTSKAWMETARLFLSNADFYRGIVEEIGDLFGEEARTSDDGSIQDSVLALKVPDLVRKAINK